MSDYVHNVHHTSHHQTKTMMGRLKVDRTSGSQGELVLSPSESSLQATAWSEAISLAHALDTVDAGGVHRPLTASNFI